jgi:lysyl endopeptidase
MKFLYIPLGVLLFVMCSAGQIIGAPASAIPPDSFATTPQWVFVQPALASPYSDEVASASRDEFKGRLQIGESRPLAQAVVVDAWTAPTAQWISLAGGWRSWAIDLESTGALGLKVHLESLQLPEGARLIVYNPESPQATVRIMSGKRIQGGRELWTDTLFTDKARVECQVPPNADLTSVRFVVSGLSHIYKLPKASSQLKEGTCHNDVSCFPDWASQAAGVAWIVFIEGGRTFLCTGCLLDANDPATPDYFLTAHHCIGNQTVASTIEFYWFYQTAFCDGPAPDPGTVPRTGGGGDLLKTSSNSDFAFLRLREAPPGGTFRLGWSTSPPTTDLAGIHHPDGSYKRISFGTSAGVASHFWQVQWNSGVTEPGSSGSPLLNSDKKVIGQLYGGLSSCTDPSGIDKYGRFDLTYDLIQPWIDPGTNGILQIPRGLYNGLFAQTDGAALESAGFISIVTAASGKFSGSLHLSGAKYAFSGQFDANGAAQILVNRPGLSEWTLSLQLDAADTGHLTGSLTDGVFISPVDAGLATFSAKTNAAPEFGHYNILMSSANDDAAVAPVGYSFISVVVDKNGKVKATGTLADGSRLAATASLTKDGRWPFFITPYAGKGFCLGWISFADSAQVGGSLTWIKPSSATGKFYPAGFAISPTTSGSIYAPPVAGTSVLNAPTATLTVSGGNLADAISIPISISANNKVTTTSTNKLALTISASSGAVAGKLVLPGIAKPLVFKGLVDQHQNIAGGFFLGTNQAGRMLLTP